MSSTLHVDTSCASESGTSEEAQGPLDSRKGTCVSTLKMGNLISVPQLACEGSVKENVAFSRNCQGLYGVNNNVEATPLSEVRKEVKAREREHEALCDNLDVCESVIQVIPAGDGHFETQTRVTSSAEKENSFVNGNSKSEIISKSKTLGSLENKEEIITENCDSISCITTANVFQNNSNLVKNKSDIGSRAENENVVQKNEHNANPICNDAIDCVSDKCGQDNSNISLEVEKANGKKDIDVMCIENKTSKKAVSVHCQYWNSCERENNLNNEVDSERSDKSIEITPETQQNQQNITLLDLKNGEEGASAETEIAPMEGSSDIIHQSPDGPKQQIDNEPKNKEFLKNEGEEPDKINMISISADEFQSNHEQQEMDEQCGIDNTCQHSEIESKSPSSQDVNCEPSLSECDINTKMKCEDNVNKGYSERLPFHTELSPNCAKLLTKEHSGGYSSDNSSIKKSPIFQRGLFPRIAIRNSGVLAAKKLRKQLFIEKEKTAKRELQQRDKVCVSTNDIKLKCAQVNLVKMNAHLLSKYNVNFPSLDLDGCVGRKFNSVSLSCGRKSSVNEKRNNLGHKIGCQVESGVSFEGQRKKNAKFSCGKEDTDQIMEMSSKPCSESLVKDISNSRTNCDTSSLEKNSNLTGSDNTFHGAMEIKRRSKRRDSAPAFTPTKKQKQSEMKVARVNILKIDDLVLLKYGYDSQGLKIDKASIVPCSAPSPSVNSFVGNSVKTIENHVLNSPDHSNHAASLASMKNSDKREMNDTIKKSSTTHQTTNSQKARERLNIEDVPLSNRVVSKNTLSTEKLMAKTKCSVGKSSGNLKTPKVLMKRIDKESLSNDVLSKKSYDLNPTKTNYKIKGSFKKAELDGKIPHKIVKRKGNTSGRILINRSRSTTKSITKKKNSIKNKYNLKTAQVILKNINNSPLSRYILSEYLPTKRECSASISKPKFHIQSTEILQKRPLPKKQITSQSKNCGSIDKQNEMANKASLCKGDAQDHSKENMCLNSDLKCLKGVRVNLDKLESTFQPKILSSKHVLSS